MIKKKILVTGSNSGLGKYLVKSYRCYALNRKTNINLLKNKKWKLIIHCANNSKNINSKNLNISQLVNDNILLSETIAKLNGKKVFISSTEVYRNCKKNKDINEKTKININKIKKFYARSKLISENFFLKDKNNLIIRLGSIVGPSMKNNTAKKILSTKRRVTLSSKSTFSYVHYSEIKKFIDISYSKNISGIFNLLRTDYLSLLKISKILKNKKKFGTIKFNVVKASNKKISKYINLEKYSSIDILKQSRDYVLKTT